MDGARTDKSTKFKDRLVRKRANSPHGFFHFEGSCGSNGFVNLSGKGKISNE